MSSPTLLTDTATSTLPSTRLATLLSALSRADTATLTPTASSRPSTTNLMLLDSVSRPPTCQLPQSLRVRHQSSTQSSQSLQFSRVKHQSSTQSSQLLLNSPQRLLRLPQPT